MTSYLTYESVESGHFVPMHLHKSQNRVPSPSSELWDFVRN